jgi:hypothetical protein
MKNLFVLKVAWKKTVRAAVYLFEPTPFPLGFLSWGVLAILWVLNLVNMECKTPTAYDLNTIRCLPAFIPRGI